MQVNKITLQGQTKEQARQTEHLQAKKSQYQTELQDFHPTRLTLVEDYEKAHLQLKTLKDLEGRLSALEHLPPDITLAQLELAKLKSKWVLSIHLA